MRGLNLICSVHFETGWNGTFGVSNLLHKVVGIEQTGNGDPSATTTRFLVRNCSLATKGTAAAPVGFGTAAVVRAAGTAALGSLLSVHDFAVKVIHLELEDENLTNQWEVKEFDLRTSMLSSILQQSPQQVRFVPGYDSSNLRERKRERLRFRAEQRKKLELRARLFSNTMA